MVLTMLVMEDELMKEDDILKEIDSISRSNHNSRSGLSHQRVMKLKALGTEDELTQILYLVDSHVPNLRERASMRYELLLMKENNEDTRNYLKNLKDIISTKCSASGDDCVGEMKRQIAEMPKEWNIVQLTSRYNPLEYQNLDANIYHTNGLHISVFDCGQNDANPLLVTVDPPSLAGNKLELLQNLMNVLNDNNERLSSTAKRNFFRNRKEKYDYILKSEDNEMTLKGIVAKSEKHWLREWRCLLIGKYQDESVEQSFRLELENIIKDQLADVSISKRSKGLLCHVIKGAAYLTRLEILKAVQYCLNDIRNQNIIKEVSRLIKEANVRINSNHVKLLRHPVILIVDEVLDSLPWEMMEILNGEPVSRIPSLHFAYLLFKSYEKEIEDGHKIIKNYENGKYVVNPDGDLTRMEVRMMSFFNYWLRNWNGINNRKPAKNEFYNLLKEADIFLYSGHGNGTHIMTVEMLQKTEVKAVVLLFGCASTRIARLGTQVDMYGSYHMYLISRCPCVLGMLWPVTDFYTDILTTEFLSNWVPSKASIPWRNVDKQQWNRALKCDTFVSTNKIMEENLNNLELLRALANSKKLTEHYFTKAACVVRGLPVKIKFD